MGASNFNTNSLAHLSSQAFALKMYLNTTFSTLMLESMELWMLVCLCMKYDITTNAFSIVSSTIG